MQDKTVRQSGDSKNRIRNTNSASRETGVPCFLVLNEKRLFSRCMVVGARQMSPVYCPLNMGDVDLGSARIDCNRNKSSEASDTTCVHVYERFLVISSHLLALVARCLEHQTING